VPLEPKKAGEDDQYGINAVSALSLGFNGQTVIHPDKNSSGGRADQGAVFLTRDMVAEGHLWAGGSFSDLISYFGEVTFASSGSITVEHAQVFANDLFGPKHAVNVRVGRGFSTLSSFGPHSSYLADQIMPSSGATSLNGATAGGWNVFDHFNGFEVNGVIAGRIDYSVGLNAGTDADTRPSENFYGHVGYKLGGMRLDGEGASAAKDAMRPWEETALTIDAFVYRAVDSVSFGYIPDPTLPAVSATVTQLDSATVVGANLRAQLNSIEFNGGIYRETHNRASIDGTGAALGGVLWAPYGELSYVVEPWFVPAVRVEGTSLANDGGTQIHNLRITPGIASAVRPNIKLVLTCAIESASGTPPGTAATAGWGTVGGTATPSPTSTQTSTGLELESVQIYGAFAF
jgi:hypothetical protein